MYICQYKDIGKYKYVAINVCMSFCIDDRIIYTVLDPLFNLMMYHRTITTAYIIFHIHEIKLCTLFLC